MSGDRGSSEAVSSASPESDPHPRRGAAAFALLAIGLAGVLALKPWLDGPRREQPIAFNHRAHVEDLGFECTDCHRHALSGVRATIPDLGVCADCHEEATTDSADEARLVELVQTGEPIPWQKVYWVPPDIYFSHRRHTALGEIECAVCHGDVASFEEPITRRAVAVTMEGCMDCHERREVSNDCIYCHH